MVWPERSLRNALQATLSTYLRHASRLRIHPNHVVVNHLSSIHPFISSSAIQKSLRTLSSVVEAPFQAGCKPVWPEEMAAMANHSIMWCDGLAQASLREIMAALLALVEP